MLRAVRISVKLAASYNMEWSSDGFRSLEVTDSAVGNVMCRRLNILQKENRTVIVH